MMTYSKYLKSALILKKELDSEPTYKKGFLKTEVKYHGDKLTNLQDTQIPKLGSSYSCLAVISLDSALKKAENYYPQVFLKECVNILRKKQLDILLMTQKVFLMIPMISMILMMNKLKI